MKTYILYSVLIIIFSCSNNFNKSPDNKGMYEIIKSFHTVYHPCKLYFFIPSNTCYGCRKHAIDVLNDISKKSKHFQTIIITSDLSLVQNQTDIQIILDTNKTIDRNLFLSEKLTLYYHDNMHQFTLSNIDSLQKYIQQVFYELQNCK